jgi:predicted DNA-binding WGR domain protein
MGDPEYPVPADDADPAATAAAGVREGHAARFVSVEPAQRRFRFYEVRLQPTLWGGVALVRAWGRLGTPGRSRASEYPDQAAAGPAVERAVRRRLRRGYRLVGGAAGGVWRAAAACPPADAPPAPPGEGGGPGRS